MKIARYLLPALALGFVFGLRRSSRPSPRHRIVVDVSTPNADTWKRVLSNLDNVRRQLGADVTEIEVVAYGPGLGMLLAESAPELERMERLSREAVLFAACRNTLEGRALGSEALLPFVRIVPSGVAEIVLKQEAGWSLLKPGS
ncbi:DsrE/DsrF-like family protein [compost metagenome]